MQENMLKTIYIHSWYLDDVVNNLRSRLQMPTRARRVAGWAHQFAHPRWQHLHRRNKVVIQQRVKIDVPTMRVTVINDILRGSYDLLYASPNVHEMLPRFFRKILNQSIFCLSPFCVEPSEQRYYAVVLLFHNFWMVSDLDRRTLSCKLK